MKTILAIMVMVIASMSVQGAPAAKPSPAIPASLPAKPISSVKAVPANDILGKWHALDPSNGWESYWEFLPNGVLFYTCTRDAVPRTPDTWTLKNGHINSCGMVMDAPINPEGMGTTLSNGVRLKFKRVEVYAPQLKADR